ncbi:copper resistance CopC/CopD family protein [Streptomyces ortus]|uniref:Copper resistance protein CopC n=1 Tax=Streptomyces ortus TaxID=2867268 RepID=A0ABT3V741_9ACTN|nr:copper resistance protein CopC [Streptomyces ortus]MCX4235427.1 copper resistance protein CopC [Streptomyces ortus]
MSQTIAPRVRTLLLLLLAVTGALLAGAVPVSAHAALTGSDPQQGAVVTEAPAQVSLTFSEQVAMSDGSVRVLDPKGERVDTGKTSGQGGNTYAVKLHSGLPDGTFTVTYQVVSADSHPVSGAFTFSIGAPSTTTVAVSDQEAGGGLVGGLYGFARYVSYAGFILLVGGSAFVLACWQRGTGVRAVQRLVVSGWLALTGATLAMLMLRGSYTGSGKFGDIFDLNLLSDVLQTKTGAALVSRLLLLAAAALFIAVLFGAYEKREDEEEKGDLTFGLAIGGFVVAAGLAATWAMAEHASTGLQAGIAMPADVLHLLAVAVWLGGLSTLLVVLYRAPSIERSAVQRFSQVAFGSVAVLVVTGIYQSWRQVGSWSALTGTWYGQLLLIKVALVVVLVGIAYVSRRWTARLAQTPTSAAKQSVKASVGAAASKKSNGSAAPTGGKGAKASKSPKGAKSSKASKVSTGSEENPDDKVTVPAGGEGGSSGGGAGGGGKRAAQLARQRAAVATARDKRLRDADPLRSGLRRSVLAEAGVAVVLLAVTTVLTSTEPGRTEEEAKAATAAASAAQTGEALSLDIPFDTGGEDGKGIARVELDPARVGGNDMHVYVERPNGKAFDIPEVKVSFTLKAKDIGPLPVVPDRIATGHWTASGVQIPMAGNWQIEVTVRTSDIDQVTVDKNAQIG